MMGSSVLLSVIGGVAMTVLAISALAGIWVLSLGPTSVSLDEVTLCLKDSPLEQHTIVLVDGTDPWSTLHIDILKAAIDEEKRALPLHAKLSVVSIAPDQPWEPIEIVGLCNPGTGSDASPVTQNPRRLRKVWDDAFSAPITASIAQSIDQPPGEQSPIMQTVTALARRPDFDARVPHRRLRIVSDLLQNDQRGYSQYRTGDLWETFVDSDLALQANAHLTGIEIRVDYLQRPAAAIFQGPSHREFWERWFNERGATAVQLEVTEMLQRRDQNSES